MKAATNSILVLAILFALHFLGGCSTTPQPPEDAVPATEEVVNEESAAAEEEDEPAPVVAEKQEPAPEEQEGAGEDAGEEEEEDEEQTYADVVPEDAETDEGLFLVHRVDGKLLFEIPDELFGRDFLLVSRIARVPAGMGSGFIAAGHKSGEQVVRWERMDDRVLLRKVSYRNVADAEEPIYRSVLNNNFFPILAAFDVEAEGPPAPAAEEAEEAEEEEGEAEEGEEPRPETDTRQAHSTSSRPGSATHRRG